MPRFGLLLVAAAAAVCGAASLVQAQAERVTELPSAAIVGLPPMSCPRACLDLADRWKNQIWRDNECDAYRPESALSSGCRDFAEKQGSAYLTMCQDCCDTLYRWTHSCKPPQDTKYPPTVSDRVEVASPPATFTQSTPCLDGCTRMADGASAFCRERVKPRERRQCHALVAATHDQCQATCQSESDRQVVKVNSVVGESALATWLTWPEGTCQFRCELNTDKSDSWIHKCAISCPPCLPQVQELYTACMFAAGLAPKNEVASEKAFCLNQLNERKALCH